MDVSFFFLQWQLQLCYHVSQLHIHSIMICAQRERMTNMIFRDGSWLTVICNIRSRSYTSREVKENCNNDKMHWRSFNLIGGPCLSVKLRCWKWAIVDASPNPIRASCVSNLKHYYTESAAWWQKPSFKVIFKIIQVSRTQKSVLEGGWL